MEVRYDLVYMVKELSRVLQERTKIAREIWGRTLTCMTQTEEAHLEYNNHRMTHFTSPPTRKKHGHTNKY
jgi:hypothetical protein